MLLYLFIISWFPYVVLNNLFLVSILGISILNLVCQCRMKRWQPQASLTGLLLDKGFLKYLHLSLGILLVRCAPLLFTLEFNKYFIDYSDLVFSYLLWWQLSSPIHDIGSHIIFNQKLSALGLQYFERFGVCFPCLCYITISPALHL